MLATELYLPMYNVRLDGFTSLGWADRLRDNGYRPAWQVDVGDDHATAETVNRPGKVHRDIHFRFIAESTDPLSVEKVVDVAVLYHNTPGRVVVPPLRLHRHRQGRRNAKLILYSFTCCVIVSATPAARTGTRSRKR